MAAGRNDRMEKMNVPHLEVLTIPLPYSQTPRNGSAARQWRIRYYFFYPTIAWIAMRMVGHFYHNNDESNLLSIGMMRFTRPSQKLAMGMVDGLLVQAANGIGCTTAFPE